MFVRANFLDIYLQRMRDRSMQSGAEWEIKLTVWSMTGHPSNRSSGVQISRDIYSAKCVGRVKIQTTSKSSQRYYTTKLLIRYLLSNTPNLYVRASGFPGHLFTENA